MFGKQSKLSKRELGTIEQDVQIPALLDRIQIYFIMETPTAFESNCTKFYFAEARVLMITAVDKNCP